MVYIYVALHTTKQKLLIFHSFANGMINVYSQIITTTLLLSRDEWQNTRELRRERPLCAESGALCVETLCKMQFAHIFTDTKGVGVTYIFYSPADPLISSDTVPLADIKSENKIMQIALTKIKTFHFVPFTQNPVLKPRSKCV